MSCERLRMDMNNACTSVMRKYFQEVVLVNKNDIQEFYIQSPQFRDFVSNRYMVSFTIKPGTRGYRITNTYNGNVVFGSYNKTEEENIPQYKHIVQISMTGIDEETKAFLDQLDFSNYVAFIQSTNGLIEVYGFQYGLKTEDYEYNPVNNNGGALLTLSSDEDILEDERPYIYVSSIEGNENDDFNNNFENNTMLPDVLKLIIDHNDKYIINHNNYYLTTENY